MTWGRKSTAGPIKAPKSFEMSRIEARKSDSLVMVDKVVHMG